MIDDARTLAIGWAADLDDPAAARARADRARAVADRGGAGLDAATDALVELLP
jgi:hypothetical protein